MRAIALRSRLTYSGKSAMPLSNVFRALPSLSPWQLSNAKQSLMMLEKPMSLPPTEMIGRPACVRQASS